MQTLDGSKVKHQFLDIGVAGKLMWRHRPCHQCEGCMLGDYKRIMSECKYNDICGQAEVVEMEVSGKPSTVLTRNQAMARGETMAEEVVVSDFVVIEVDNADAAVPWLIGEVDEPVSVHLGSDVSNYCGTVCRGDNAYKVRRWMPLQNGGGSSTFQWTDEVCLVQSSSTRWRVRRDDANSTHFKLGRSVHPECPKHHKLTAKSLSNLCDICDTSGTAWRCARCDYDVCSACKIGLSLRRRLRPCTKLSIFSRMPNVDEDPYEDVDGGDDWSCLYTVQRASTIRDVALDVKVSLGALIDHNDGINLQTTSSVRRGTTLWVPGPTGTRKAGPGAGK